MTPAEHDALRAELLTLANEDIISPCEAEWAANGFVSSSEPRTAVTQVLQELLEEGAIAFYEHHPGEPLPPGGHYTHAYGHDILLDAATVEQVLVDAAHWAPGGKDNPICVVFAATEYGQRIWPGFFP